jgi:hypothetical protein
MARTKDTTKKKTSSTAKTNKAGSKVGKRSSTKTNKTAAGVKKTGLSKPNEEGKHTNNEELDNDTSLMECTVPSFIEPEIPWAESKAKALLMQDIIDGVVPKNPCSTMPTNVIFTSRPEYAEYGYSAFSGRLSRLRAQINRELKRAEDDLAAFNNYKAHNVVHKMSAHGYPEWDGSDAQKQLKLDIDDGLHEILEPKELWCYREVYDSFPLRVFKDHIYQEIDTRKYLHTLDVKGKSNMKPSKNKEQLENANE